MRLVRRGDFFPRQRYLGCVLGCRDRAAHVLKAQVQQVGVEDVGFAIAADVLDPAGLVRRMDLGALQPELARKAAQPRHRVQARVGARLKRSEHVHQVQVSSMEAAEIIVVAEVAVVIAPIPVARRGHAVNQAAMVQHRQIEATAVPRYELRGVAIDAVEKAADQLRFGVGRLSQRPDAKALSFAQCTGDGNDTLQMQLQKFTPGRRAPLLEGPIENIGVGECGRQGMDAPQPGNVGNRLDIEDQCRWHGAFKQPVLRTASPRLRRSVGHVRT